MTEPLNVMIDLRESGLGEDREALEARSLTLADEMRSGNLVETARLARQEDLPEGAKSGMLAFVGGLLTAEISRENLKKTIGFLGNRFYGEKLTISYKVGDCEYVIDYRDPAKRDEAIASIEQLEHLRIRVQKMEDASKSEQG
ncbi:MAG: hypothetical protein AAFQ63_20640 [Cyanobacteria bacterium J06621_11]